MKSKTELRITWLGIGILTICLSLIIYQINPYLSIIPEVLTFALLLTNLRAFKLTFKELIFGVEQE